MSNIQNDTYLENAMDRAVMAVADGEVGEFERITDEMWSMGFVKEAEALTSGELEVHCTVCYGERPVRDGFNGAHTQSLGHCHNCEGNGYLFV